MQSRIFDLGIFESLNGGDALYVSNDLKTVKSYEGLVYMSLFGGNLEGNTPAVSTSENKDYWANRLLWNDVPEQQFNSNTERTLNSTALNSSGRITIENAVKSDLKYLSTYGTVKVSVTLPRLNTVRIEVRTEYLNGPKILTILEYVKKTGTGDYSMEDYSEEDYY